METVLESYRRRAETSRLMDKEKHGYHRFDARGRWTCIDMGQPDNILLVAGIGMRSNITPRLAKEFR